MRTLVTGGIRSGKSRCAEDLLAGAERVSYLAPGPVGDPDADPEWADRVATHQARRPAHWQTIETPDVAAAIAGLESPALLDCLGTWLTAQLDLVGSWTGDTGWETRLNDRVEELVRAWADCPHDLVAVTNEVGMGLVSEHRSGRIFTDWLGRVNQRIAEVSDGVILVVAGRRLRL